MRTGLLFVGFEMSTIDLFKAEASILLKVLRDPRRSHALRAAMRLRGCQAFQGWTGGRILAQAASVQRRHALEAIAREQGFASWGVLKTRAETMGLQPPHSDLERAVDGIAGVHLSRWFPEYGEAAMHHAADGGFLLPYRAQFILMDGETVRALAFDPADPDWSLIGFDLARSGDQEARERLLQRWRRACRRAAFPMGRAVQ